MGERESVLFLWVVAEKSIIIKKVLNRKLLCDKMMNIVIKFKRGRKNDDKDT